MSLVLLNLAGGESVDDINKLEGDEGFCRILRKVEEQGLTRKERRELKSRWRKGRTRTLPSASALFRYLANFHDTDQETYRQEGKAFIPNANDHLKALGRINKELIGFENIGEETATLDMDATLSAAWKDQALCSYKGDKSFQPLKTYWYERGIILHSVSGRQRAGWARTEAGILGSTGAASALHNEGTDAVKCEWLSARPAWILRQRG